MKVVPGREVQKQNYDTDHAGSLGDHGGYLSLHYGGPLQAILRVRPAVVHMATAGRTLALRRMVTVGHTVRADRMVTIASTTVTAVGHRYPHRAVPCHLRTACIQRKVDASAAAR